MALRATWVGVALFSVLGIGSALAQDAPPSAPATPAAPASRSGTAPGRASIGGLIGASSFYTADEYSQGSLARFNFVGQIRYVASPHWRYQISPGFTWSAYSKNEPPPFVDIKNPGDTTKENYLTQLIPITVQIQRTWGKL